ncbi:hypothetical protein LOAG_12978 [Loa loa]|nr:hypothetical protein LOAG_12978 [Loa loa]EFO15530.1 hypothetical protein LOAG_12978 [Loa loa]
MQLKYSKIMLPEINATYDLNHTIRKKLLIRRALTSRPKMQSVRRIRTMSVM